MVYRTYNEASYEAPSPSAGKKVANVCELAEQILLHLAYADLLHCLQVSPLWHTLIRSSTELQRLLYKIPTPISKTNLDPHFLTPDDVARTAIIPGGRYENRSVLDICSADLEKFMDRAVETSHPMIANARLVEYYENVRYVRGMFQGMRIPNGWPIALQQIYCELCQGFHARFQHHNLHPLLRFLEDVDICWKGRGSRIYMATHIVHHIEVPRSCWEHYGEMFMLEARKLKRAVEIVDQYKMQDDMFISPICTQLIIKTPAAEGQRDFLVLHDPAGLKLKWVLDALVHVCKRQLYSIVDILRGWETRGAEGGDMDGGPG
ncbi:hypothetical protein N0V90_008802 [Kalmusia sp. IMI 367209]|nr:hypothetical protein N0V90_008802 [Kalmusia sp. IMI 367209]